MNRMRCRSEDGRTWTTVQVRDLREQLGIAVFDPATVGVEIASADEAAHRLGVLQRGVHTSTRQLEADIRAFIEKHNEDPKPFRWTKSADDILAATLLSPCRSKLMP